MLKVLAGDWKEGPAGLATTMTGKMKRLVLPKGWLLHERIRPDQIASVEIVTQENQSSILGKAAWGAAGAALLGGVGLLAGVLGGGNKNVMTAMLRLADGRSALISGKSKEIQVLQAAAFNTNGPI